MPSPLVRGLKRRASVAAGSSGRPTASSPTVRDRPRDPGSAQCSTAQGRPRARARTAGSHAASGIVDEEVISSSRGAGAGMNRTLSRVVVVAGVGAGVLVVRRMTTRQVGDGAARIAPDRWHTVTVNRPPEEVAPGGRGTEMAVRLRDDAPAGPSGAVARITGKDPRQEVRAALRQSKQLLETGEVLTPDEQPTARRTLRNLPLELATRRARGEGRL